MKLDPNCVRDFLIACEELDVLTEDLQYEIAHLEYFTIKMPKYSKREIAYTALLLKEADYFLGSILEADGGVFDLRILRLTYKGHELLDSIRPDSVWKVISKSLSEISSASLPVLQQLGTKLLAKSFGI